MIVSRVKLKNWRNFLTVDVELGNRVFLVGPNASGKSNFLDVFRFLRDITKPGGGLQKAIKDRGGLSKIRCLAARKQSDVEIEVRISESTLDKPIWRYAIGIKTERSGLHRPYLSYEKVIKNNKILVNRPDQEDKNDKERLTQTHLEQINANKDFRDISKYFESVLYLHLIPQLLRYPEAFAGSGISGDPFGQGFLERLAKTSKNIRQSRLRKIEQALRLTVPQLKELTTVQDERGATHLESVYEHWRPFGAKQREDQFSDGTLRLIGILWSLLDGDSLLLMEEPELSLHSAIVSKLPALFYRLQTLKKKKKRQIILSTHSFDLLSNRGIGTEEVLLLKPGKEGTEIKLCSKIKDIERLLVGGLSIGEAIFPSTVPPKIDQLGLFNL